MESRLSQIKARLQKAPPYDKGMFSTLEGMEFLWSAKSDIEYLLDTLSYEQTQTIYQREAAAAARERIRELEKVLYYYADSYNYGDGNGLSWESTDIRNDRGKKAREVLGER